MQFTGVNVRGHEPRTQDTGMPFAINISKPEANGNIAS